VLQDRSAQGDAAASRAVVGDTLAMTELNDLDDVVFLLGAGASCDAGLPLASEMTRLVLEAVQSSPRDRTNARALNYVVSAIMAHRGRTGQSPLEYPDIETVVSSVELLAERDDVELTPFVQSWDSGVGIGEASAWDQEQRAKQIHDALLEGLEGRYRFDSRKLARELASFIKAEVGTSPGNTYRQLFDFLVKKLVDILTINDAEKVAYLTPLVALGRRPNGVSIATLNYDRTIEISAQQAGVACSTGVEKWDSSGRLDFGDSAVRLYKLHGSIDWTRGSKQFRDYYNYQTEQYTPMGMDQVSLLTTPPERHGQLPFVIFGRREKLRPQGPFLDLRAAFSRRLSAARVLVVIGYSFGDEHVNALIAHWINTNEDRRLMVIDPAFPSNWQAGWRGDARQKLVYQLVRINRDVGRGITQPKVLATRLSILRKSTADCLEEICTATGDELIDRPFLLD
jgi:hypothetical protein